jgi:FMN phosphatase YigB (HAD superfamily)
MTFKTYYSLESLVAAGERISSSKQVVSFDLFDTLLVRRIHDPDLVKLPVARYISELAMQQGVRIGERKVQQLRDRTEQALRAATGAKFPDHEACYPVFMRDTLKQIFTTGYSETLLEKVTGYELEMENRMLVPRSQLARWVEQLAGRGKRLFVITDMYLPGSHIKKLVEHAGLAPFFEDVVSSADTSLAKASGSAYPLLAERYSLDPGSWLHVGDNPVSDGLRAVEAGLEAIIIEDPGEAQRKSIIKRYYNYSAGKPFWRGRALQQLMAPLESENRGQGPLYVEGYNFLGPLIGIFVQRLAELCLANGITKVFFLSREGWTFQRYWEKVVPVLHPAGQLPETEYLYVSRMALAGASCAFQGLTRVNAGIAFLPPGNSDFRDLCRIFSLDAEKFAEHLDRFGLRVDTCLSPIHADYSPDHTVAFEEMLEDGAFQEEVKAQTRDANAAMQLYFEEAGLFDHERVAIVDIGWLGTIQRFLFEAIAHRTDCPTCFGYLFGATRGVPFAASEKNILSGVMYDKDRFDLAGSTLFYARDIFEEACRAPYPTLNRYQLTGEGYSLEFRHTDDAVGMAELEQDAYFKPLQEGIIDSAERYAAASALLGYGFEDYNPWVNSVLVNKLAFPRTVEISRIRHQHHLDDFHGKKKPRPDIKKSRVPLWDRPRLRLMLDPFLRPLSFIHHLKERIEE